MNAHQEPVELIREAARLIRQRAEAATKGPWLADGSEIYSEFHGGPWVGETLADDSRTTSANSEHIASWHPGVALAVVSLLESLADLYAAGFAEPQPLVLAIARAYLGKS